MDASVRPATRESNVAASAWTGLAILWLVNLFNQIDRNLLSILQIPLKAELGLSDAQLGALTGFAFALVYCTFAIPIARWADRTIRTTLLAAAVALWCVMTSLSGLAAGFLFLVICRMGVALGESAASPISLSMIGDLFAPGRRGLPIAIWSTTVPIGTMFGVLAGGWLTTVLGWRTTFIVVGAAGLLLVPVLLWMKEPARGRYDTQQAAEIPPFMASVKLLLGSPAIRLVLVAAAVQAFVFVAAQMWSAPFYERLHGLSFARIGVGMAVMYGLGGGIGALAGGYIIDRMSTRDNRWYGWLPAATAIASIPALLAMLLASSTIASLLFGVVAIALLNFNLGPLNAAIQSLVSSHFRAFASSLVVLVSNLIGVGLGPLVVGTLSDALIARGFGDTSLRYALAAVVFLQVGTAIAFWRSARWFAADRRQQI